MDHTRRAVANSGAGPILIIWGAVWLVGYLATHFLKDIEHKWMIYWVWWPLVATGMYGSWRIGSRIPFRSLFGKRIGIFWFALFIYSDVWLVLLYPWNWVQMNAFVATLVMFAYVVLGLLFGIYLLWLGIGVILLILLGYFLLQPWFFIWMAVMAGGTLMGTGIYIERKWKGLEAGDGGDQ